VAFRPDGGCAREIFLPFENARDDSHSKEENITISSTEALTVKIFSERKEITSSSLKNGKHISPPYLKHLHTVFLKIIFIS